MQYFHNFKNLDDLRDFKVKSSVISPSNNEITRNSYNLWKDIVDKHFIKNQD